MVFQNTYRGFFYRQIFVTPALINPSTCSLVGKTGIVTGSNTGLGYHASLQLLDIYGSGLELGGFVDGDWAKIDDQSETYDHLK